MNRQSAEEIEKWLAIRKEAGRNIDPETAEVTWWSAQTMDPYGVDPDLPEELESVGREYFARSPGSDVWVWFGDIPTVTWHALWEKHKETLAFPAGLSIDDPATAIHREADGSVTDGLREVIREVQNFAKQKLEEWRAKSPALISNGGEPRS
jgi:hypothetical protein